MKFLALSVAALAGSVSAFAPAVNIAPSSSALDMARKPFISGNWKLNPQTKEEAAQLAAGIAAAVGPGSPEADVALFVPYVFLSTAMEAAGGKIAIGAEVSALGSSNHTTCVKCYAPCVKCHAPYNRHVCRNAQQGRCSRYT